MARFAYWWMTALFVACLVVVVAALNRSDATLGYVAQLWIYVFLLAGRARVTPFDIPGPKWSDY